MAQFAYSQAADIAAVLVAIIHIYFFVLESYLWKAKAAKLFKSSQQYVDESAIMAANQGFYNAILAAGLFFGLYDGNSDFKLFFLFAVFLAGLFGGVTVSYRIFIIQAVPAVIGLIFALFGGYQVRNSASLLICFGIFSVLTIFYGGYVKKANPKPKTNKAK
jgi:putative membrane protein